MQRIPNELIFQVIETLSDDPQALHPLLLVNKSVYHFSIPFFYASIIIQDTRDAGSGVLTSDSLPADNHTDSRPSPPSRRTQRLHQTLTHNWGLAVHVQTFVVGPFVPPDPEFRWDPIDLFLELFTNLKRFALTLDQSPHSLIDLSPFFHRISPKAKLTHLCCSLPHVYLWDLLELITSQAETIEFIRVVGRDRNDSTSFVDKRPLGELPNLRSIEGLLGLWPRFVARSAKLQHLTALDASIIVLPPTTDPNPSATFRNIRTIHLTSTVPTSFVFILSHLAQVELLSIGYPVYGSKLPLPIFLDIPSHQLKYLRITSVETHGSHCRPIFAQYPSLQVIDIVTLPTRRFTRTDQDYGYNMHNAEASRQIDNSMRRKEGSGMFNTWWEALEGELKDAGIDFKP